MKSVIFKFKRWYQGGPLPTKTNNPDGSITYRQPGTYEPPLIAKILNSLGRFWLRNWKFIITTTVFLIVGILTILVMLFVHHDSKNIPPTDDKNIEQKQKNDNSVHNVTELQKI